MQLQRVCDRSIPLDAYSDTEFIAHYRITRPMFMELLDRLETFIVLPTGRSHAIPMTTQLAVALQFLATGSIQIVVAYRHIPLKAFSSLDAAYL